MVKSAKVSKNRNEIQYRQIKQSTAQSCLHLQILFQKECSVGIHFFPLPRQEGDILTFKPNAQFSNNLTCTALINKAHRCMKPTDLISNLC